MSICVHLQILLQTITKGMYTTRNGAATKWFVDVCSTHFSCHTIGKIIGARHPGNTVSYQSCFTVQVWRCCKNATKRYVFVWFTCSSVPSVGALINTNGDNFFPFVEFFPHVAVLGRNQRLFYCIHVFWSHYHVLHAVVKNFHWGWGSYMMHRSGHVFMYLHSTYEF